MRDIKGYEGSYAVTSCGRVWSYKSKKFLKPQKHNSGYLLVCLYKDGKKTNYYIHKLVAEAYIDNPNGYSEVNHIDEIKEHNYVNNLEWISHKDNCNYGTRNARVSEKLSKPVCQYSLNGEWIATYKSMHEAEQNTGIPNEHICRCCKGELKKTGGYRWKYLDE